ncbi:energy transducer TonB [Pseudomonas sp. PB120]|uniref:energy transducer TonB n=1 Tax=Pseudomonas sp. PB120 TaxID=2494700 RepID=UPI0012FD2ED0|nr:energy transducer TonB [Pseudomonas sp. PB120]MVV49790.1 energy transducer TonB [Pseudomonas sp. PB120]
MRWLAYVLLLIVSVGAQAEEVFLIPEFNPKPIYPSALSRAGIVGNVRVRFMVNADGSVSKIGILQSDHPDLAQATRVAIAQWRFKPWKVEGDKPAEQEVVAPMVFGLDAPSDTHQWLKALKCREVNEGLVNTSDTDWVDLPAFYYTRAYLSSGFFQKQMSSEQRLAMIAKLNRRVPTIARHCMNSPVSRFMTFVPADIRSLF